MLFWAAKIAKEFRRSPAKVLGKVPKGILRKSQRPKPQRPKSQRPKTQRCSFKKKIGVGVGVWVLRKKLGCALKVVVMVLRKKLVEKKVVVVVLRKNLRLWF